MKKIFKRFIKGFLALLPVFVTVFILYRVGSGAESILGKVLKLILSDRFYVPGMGVLAGFLLIILFGFILEVRLGDKLYSLFCRLLEKIPGVKSIYSAIKSIVDVFSEDSSKKKDFNKVVKVSCPDGTSEIGLMTRDDFSGLPEGIADIETDEVAVLLPWSLQMGGRTVLVPKTSISFINMPPEQAFKLVFTGFAHLEGKKGG